MIQAPSNTVLTRIQTGSLASNIAFGTWNGTATSASLINQYGATPNTARGVNIWRTDWQGRQLLYPTARTNYQLQSALAGSMVMVGTGPATVTHNVAFGGQTCDAVTYTSTTATGYAGSAFVGTSSPIPSGQVTSYYYVGLSRALTGSESVFCYTTGSQGSDTSTSITASNSSNYVSTLVRISILYANAISPATLYPTIYLASPLSSNLTVYVYGCEMESGSSAGVLINTTTAPVTLTDYTLTGTTVSLAQAPAATATTDWDGTGFSNLGQNIAFTSSATSYSAPMDAQTFYLRLAATAACMVSVQANQVANPQDLYIAPNERGVYLNVTPGCIVSVKGISGSGNLSVQECSL